MYSKNILSSLFSQGVRIVFKCVVSVFVVRVLGKDNYGQAAYFLLVFNLCSLYGQFGITNGSGYFSKSDPLPVQEQFTSNATYLIINALVLWLLFCVPPVKDLVLPGYTWPYMIMGLLYLQLRYQNILLKGYYTSRNELYLANRYKIAGSIFSSSAIFVVWLCGKISSQTYILLLVLEALLTAALMYRGLPYKYRPALNASFLFREWKYGNIIFWAGLFGYLNYRVDQLMIRFQCGNGSFAVYSVAVSIAEIVFFIPEALSEAVFGKILNMQEDAPNRKLVIASTVKCCLYASFFISACGMIASPLIRYVYGSDYVEAIPCTQILFLGVCGASAAKVIFPIFLAKGQPLKHLRITFLTFVSNIVMNSFFIPLWGIKGAAIASTISYFLYGGYYIVLLKRWEHVSVRSLLLITRSDVKRLADFVLPYLPFAGKRRRR